MSYAAVFPGQGAQSVGMMAQLGPEPIVARAYARASELLGYDLWALASDGPAEQQSLTEYTQPLMLVASIAAYDLAISAGIAKPAVVAGHSLGEYSALYAAGAISFDDVVQTVKLRAELMRDAVPAGAGGMAAVLGLDDQKIIDICAQCAGDEVLQAVNFNAPGQVVISGHKTALERALPVLKDAGAKRAMMLAVSVPNHSALMRPAIEPLYAKLEAVLGDAKIPVVQNQNAALASSRADLLAALREHVASPVRWVDCVNSMMRSGAQLQIEFGPGKVLTGLAKRIDKQLPTEFVENTSSLQSVVERLKTI